MDVAVLAAQQWVNANYLSPNGFNTITEDGITGQNTVKALIIALQIEIGVNSPNGTFGPATTSLCPTLSKNVNAPASNIVRILQHGMFCKGYSTQSVTGIFGDNTENAVITLQSDAGLSTTGIVTPLIFKAVLSTDPLKLASDGNSQIRYIQQQLNNKYNQYFGVIATNGKYERNTNKALIYALQAEEGLGVNTANGTFGPTTQQLCPTISENNATSYPEFVKLVKYALVCNNISVSSLDSSYTTELQEAITSFQSFLVLPSNPGIVDLNVWMSLMTSKGNPARPATGCDCATVIDANNISVLVNNGYTHIGRYLTGLYKLTRSEISVLSQHQIRIFPIFQRSGEGNSSTHVGYFNSSQAIADARDAIQAAINLGFYVGTTIYFTVDYDAYDSHVTNYIIPYFHTLDIAFKNYNYAGFKIGIYGPRNVCSRVSQAGYASYSFVSDMSSGYSGNLGYSMPTNWSFDQFNTTTITDPQTNSSIEIDKDTVRGTDSGALLSVYSNSEVLFSEAHNCALMLTAQFEGRDDGYSTIAGNSDGMGLSLGIIQFNIGSGTLQPLFSDIINNERQLVLSVLGSDKTAELETMLSQTLNQQISWAISINDNNNQIVSDWKSALIALCQTTEFRAIQNYYIEYYKIHAIDKCYLFGGFSTCRSYAFMFDCSVQFGSFYSSEAFEITSLISSNMTEIERLQVIAEVLYNSRASVSGYARQTCIINGSGIVNGSIVSISDYGIDDKEITDLPPQSINS
jgi:peptidoglycan hydrolase-like protein with peptidoglycan-binding domain